MIPWRARARLGALDLVRPLLGSLYRGLGSVLLFHRVRGPDPHRLLTADDETTPEYLEHCILEVRRRGFDWISLDELHVRLTTPKARPSKPAAVLTLDDGYAEWASTVLDLLRRHGVPAAMFVTTGFIDGALAPWRAMADRWLEQRRSVDLAVGDRRIRLDAESLGEKLAARGAIRTLFGGLDPDEADAMARRHFGAPEDLVGRWWLDWSDVRRLVNSGLVTIGSHSVRHPVFRRLEPAALTHELDASRRLLEEQLGIPIRDLAYPFGSEAQVGPREVAAAAQAGYRMAFTTRLGNVFPEHRRALHALPRLYPTYHHRRELRLLLSGVAGAVRQRGSRVGTVR